MELPPKRVEDFLHQRIPLAKTLNCQIIESSSKQLALQVPKFVNTIKDTDFSDASAMCICQLASWTFLQVSLQRLDYKPLVNLDKADWIRKREFDSKSNAITATCSPPSDKEWQQFLRMLSRKARASVALETVLSDDLGGLATLTCEYDTRDLDPS